MEIRARYVLIGLLTLAVIVGAFGFIYWLNASGGLGERVTYRVRFPSSVAGLFLGSDVLFNGIRVGEVTDLRISNESPGDVIATIEVVADMPVRSDTRAGLQYGGLTGTASIALQGGTAGAPPPTPPRRRTGHRKRARRSGR
jgi:phospholipid/cholesterol/gamma-HCH transport system substrate-binding protein